MMGSPLWRKNMIFRLPSPDIFCGCWSMVIYSVMGVGVSVSGWLDAWWYVYIDRWMYVRSSCMDVCGCLVH